MVPDCAYKMPFSALFSTMEGAAFSFNRNFRTDGHKITVLSFFEPYSWKRLGIQAPDPHSVQNDGGWSMHVSDDKRLLLEVSHGSHPIHRSPLSASS